MTAGVSMAKFVRGHDDSDETRWMDDAEKRSESKKQNRKPKR